MAEATNPKPAPAPDRNPVPAKPAVPLDTVPKAEEEAKDYSLLPVAGDIFLWIILAALALRAYNILLGRGRTFQWESTWFYQKYNEIEPAVHQLVSSYVVLAKLASLFFIIGIIYSLYKTVEYQKIWDAKHYPDPVTETATEATNQKWQNVIVHIQSDNPSDWRLSILEADIILGDLLDALGVAGDTIGDKLKRAEVTKQFKTLNDAWEAHKIRNAIAHQGQDFVLTQREARRIIGLYENVFREFDYI